MPNQVDPKNAVGAAFFLRCGIHPSKAPEPPVVEPVWKPAAPDLEAVYVNPSRKAERWFQ
jgi:hypothetical protein